MPLIPSLQPQRIANWVFGWYRHRVWLLTAAMLWVAPPVRANPLADYCVERFTQELQPPSVDRLINEESPKITFSVKGEPFHLDGFGSRLWLTQGADPMLLAKVPVPQREFGRINTLVLSEDGWLWIDGGEVDYMAPLDLQQLPPTLGSPVALPELMKKPCISIVWHLLRACSPTQSRYSTLLNRAFVTGHQVTLLGRSALASFEIFAGEANLLPKKFQGARFVLDVPKLNGSLLQGPDGEVLFHDGTSITTLRSAEVTSGGWTVEAFVSGRTYLSGGSNQSGRQPFLMELKEGPTLLTIPLSKKWLNCHAICACGW